MQIEYYGEVNGDLQRIQSLDPLSINSSIPQGSVIGCILSLIYINELQKLCKPLCVLFAVDVFLLFECPKQDIVNTNNEIVNTL